MDKKHKKNTTYSVSVQWILACSLLFYFSHSFAEEIPSTNTPAETVAPDANPVADTSSVDTETVSNETVEQNTDKSENTPPENETAPEVAATENDPLLEACKGAAAGEEKVVDGVTINCKGEKNNSEVFDFQAATPIEEPSAGFVGFSDKYLNELYLVTGLGYANYASMVSFSDIDGIASVFEEYGYNDTSITGTQHGANFNIGLGYIANRFLLIELGYSYLGTTGIVGTASDEEELNTLDYSLSGTMSSLDISTLAQYKLNDLVLLPITNIIHILALVEAHQWSRTNTRNFLAEEVTWTESGYGFSLGLGADFQVNKYLTVRSMWRYKTISNEGISSFLISAVMKNNTRYAQAIQNSIINPIQGLWKK